MFNPVYVECKNTIHLESMYNHQPLRVNVNYTLEHFIFLAQNTHMPHTAMCWRSGTVPRKPSGCTAVENMWWRRREEKL